MAPTGQCLNQGGIAMALTIFSVVLAPPVGAPASGGEGSRQWSTFYAIETNEYGVIEARPESLHGNWVIGGRRYTTIRKTRFIEKNGPLEVGGCARVRLRNDRVREIGSVPWRYCR